MFQEATGNSIVNKIIDAAKLYGWTNPVIQEQNAMLSVFKEDMRINIYYTTMTVATCLKHPYKGKTQLFRRNVSSKQLIKIFENPRVHTYKGYYEKR